MEYNSFKNMLIVLPEFYLGTSILTMVIFGSAVIANKKKNFPLLSDSMITVALLVLTFEAVLLCDQKLVLDTVFFSNTFIQDPLSLVIKIILVISTIVCLVITKNYIKHQKLTSFEYILIVLLSLEGLLLLSSTYDLISIYLAIELQSLSFYAMAGYKKNSTFSTESGLKYFILGSISSGFLLLGFSYIYGFTGLTNLEDLSVFVFQLNDDTSVFLSLAIIFVLTGIFFKLAAAPFHLWSPDIYEGSPTVSTVFFAVLPKLSLTVLLVRVVYFSFSSIAVSFSELFSFIALISVFIGSLGALKQRKVKSLIAYSSISHVGFLILAFSTISFEGIHSMLFYLFIYVFTSLGVWSILMSVNFKKYYLLKSTKHLSDLTFLSITNPTLALLFSTAFFSLAGIPPLVGFYSKAIVFLCSIESSIFLFTTLIILISVISTFYYLRIIKTLYFEKTKNIKLCLTIDYSKSILSTIVVIGLLILFINPNLVTLVCYKISLL